MNAHTHIYMYSHARRTHTEKKRDIVDICTLAARPPMALSVCVCSCNCIADKALFAWNDDKMAPHSTIKSMAIQLSKATIMMQTCEFCVTGIKSNTILATLC